MSTATFFLLTTIVLAAFLIGALVILSVGVGQLRKYARLAHSVPMTVACPRSGGMANIRVLSSGTDVHHRFRVIQCDRIPAGEPACGECLMGHAWRNRHLERERHQAVH